MQAQHGGTHSACVLRQYVGNITTILSKATKWISARDWYGPIQTSQRHFVLTSGYLGPRKAHKFRPKTNTLKTILDPYGTFVRTSEIKGGPDTILFAI